jgi:uncharacterized protein YndB with AHSA1/START domain
LTVEAKTITAEHDGTIGTTDEGRAFLRFERHLNHPVERVWRAISEPAELERWLAYHVEFEPRVGGKFVLHLGGPNNDEVPSPGEVTVFDPPRVLEATGGDEGGLLRWELKPDAGGCHLTFTHTLMPGQRPQNSVLAGWHFLHDQLPVALAGTAADWHALEDTRTEHGHLARIEEIYWHYRNQPRG